MSALQSLRTLDKRVLPEPQKSPEAWRKMASRWWFLLVFAALLLAVASVQVAVTGTAAARVMVLVGLGPMAVFCGYQAGRHKAEDDRLNGRDSMAKFRPPGV